MSAADWLIGAHGRDAAAVASAYHDLFQSPQARVVLGDLRALCHERATTFVPGDSHGMAFREGQRSVLLHIADLLDLDPTTLKLGD